MDAAAAATARSCKAIPVPSNSVISPALVRPGERPATTAPSGVMRQPQAAHPPPRAGTRRYHGLRHFISEDAGRCDQRRVELLLALGVGSHRRDMGAGLHLIAHQDRREARRDGDDDIGLGAETLKGTASKGSPISADASARRCSISGCGLNATTLANWRCSAARAAETGPGSRRRSCRASAHRAGRGA